MRRGPLRHTFLAIGGNCGACIPIHIRVCVREECKKRTHSIQLYVINQYVLKNYGHKKQVVFCLSGLAAYGHDYSDTTKVNHDLLHSWTFVTQRFASICRSLNGPALLHSEL